MISGPNNSVAVKHPRIVFSQEALIVRGRREPNTHVEFEEERDRALDLQRCEPNKECD